MLPPLYALLLTPSSVPVFRTRQALPCHTSTMSQSDYHTAILRTPLLSSCEKLIRHGVVLPSSDINHSFTRCGLKSRYANMDLPLTHILMLASTARTVWPCTIRTISGLNTFTLSHCGWQTPPVQLYGICYRIAHALLFRTGG